MGQLVFESNCTTYKKKRMGLLVAWVDQTVVSSFLLVPLIPTSLLWPPFLSRTSFFCVGCEEECEERRKGLGVGGGEEKHGKKKEKRAAK